MEFRYWVSLSFSLLLVFSGCGGTSSSSGSGGGGGGGSGGNNPVPVILVVDPPAAVTDGPDYYESVFGSSFVPSSTVQWDGTSLQTTFVNSTQLAAVVPNSARRSSGTAALTVVNPTPGGGTSNAVSVMVGNPSTPSGIGVLQLVSAAMDGSAGNGNSYTGAAITPNGRYVAFQSDATNLVAGPSSGFADIYVRDTCVGATTSCTPATMRASVAQDGSLPNGNNRSAAISSSGRYVVFDSSATNLVPNVSNGHAHVYLRDTCIEAGASCSPTTSEISVAMDGSQGNDDSDLAAISSDGRFVAFGSVATNLVPGDTNGWMDLFLRDTCFGASIGCTPSTSRISVAADATQSNAPSAYPSLSADGRYVSYRTEATNLVSNGSPVVLHDTCFGVTAGCTPSNRGIYVGYAGDKVKGAVDNLWLLSRNARFSGFGAESPNLVPGDSGQKVGAFAYDDCIGASSTCVPHTFKVSLTYNGGQPDSGSVAAAASDDGNYVVFISIADNILSYAYISSAVYVRQTCATAAAGCIPTTYLLSFDSSTGSQANSQYSDLPMITPDGHYATFISTANNWKGALQSNGLTQVWLARVH